MAFPAGLTLVTVSGQFDEFPNGGGSGYVRFWYDGQLTSSVDLSVVPTIDVRTTLVDGAFEVELPATDDPGWSPSDFAYSVVVVVGAALRKGTIQLTYSDTAVRFEDLIQWDNADVDPAVTYATYAQLVQASKDATARVATLGEFVLPRQGVSFVAALPTGTLHLTHFTAQVTETILTLRTSSGGSGEVAASGSNAWSGIMEWDGTEYTPLCVTADQPTRWAAQNTDYNAALYAATEGTGLANLASPGFNKVAGQRYAAWQLWVGSGQQPTLPGVRLSLADSLVEPRQAGYMALTAPPSGAIQAGWLTASSFAIQGLLLR